MRAKRVPTPKILKIPIDIFRCQVHVILVESIDDAEVILADVYEIELEDDDFMAMCFDFVPSGEKEDVFGYYPIVYLSNEICPGIVAHESFHCVKAITGRHRVNDEETSAYLLDYIVEETHKEIEKLKKRK